MATHYQPISVVNGRVHSTATPELTVINDTNSSKWVGRFPASQDTDLHWVVPIPANYLSGNGTVRARWKSSASSGDAGWELGYLFLNSGDAYTGALGNTYLTDTTAGANLINEASGAVTMTGAATAKTLLVRMRRNADTPPNDTLGAHPADLLSMMLEYTCDPTIQKMYIWTPANAFVIPTASSATLSYITVGSSTYGYPYGLYFPESASGSYYADCRFTLPTNYLAGLTGTPIIATASTGPGNSVWRINGVDCSVTGVSDASLTTGSNFTVATSAASRVYIATAQAFPDTVAAGNDVYARIYRYSQDASDAATGHMYLLGILWTYDAFIKNPAVIRLDPQSAAQPTTGSATITRVEDTYLSKYVVQFPNGVDTKVDYLAQLSAIHSSGGTVRIRWRSSATSGNAVWRVDVASPAEGAAHDPSLTTGTATASATDGTANDINEITFDVSSALSAVASDNIIVRVNRLGTSSSPADTLAATAEVLDVTFEATVA